MSSGKKVVHFSGEPEFWPIQILETGELAEVAWVEALDHPRLGCMPVRTSRVVQKFSDGSFETLNTIYKPKVNQPELTPEEQQVLENIKRTHDAILEEARRLVELARDTGFVLTIETEATQPFAMGHYDMVATLRPSHELYRGEA